MGCALASLGHSLACVKIYTSGLIIPPTLLFRQTATGSTGIFKALVRDGSDTCFTCLWTGKASP